MSFSRFILFVFIVLLGSCVTPYDLKTSDFQETVVVEGMITDQPGPYLVKITKAVPVNTPLGQMNPLTGATVIIKDDQGNTETLEEKSSGNYYTKTTQGVVGRTYSITISTADGESYESSDEKLLPVGDFSNLQYEFEQKEPPLTNRQITSKNGFNIYIDSEVLPEQEGRVWWRWTGTFEIFTYPQFQVTQQSGPGGAFVIVPDPPLCSGYRVGKKNGEAGGPLVAVGPLYPCTCCTCWVSQYSQVPLLSDPNFVRDGRINNQLIGFIEANVRTMNDKYYMQIEQLSVSPAVYDFWKKVKAQRNNGSSLFQTPPPKTGGNIKPSSGNPLPVIGYFAASAIKTHSIAVDKTNVPYAMNLIDTIPKSCMDAYRNSINKKPTFW